jgi:hypothetical protein
MRNVIINSTACTKTYHKLSITIASKEKIKMRQITTSKVDYLNSLREYADKRGGNPVVITSEKNNVCI